MAEILSKIWKISTCLQKLNSKRGEKFSKGVKDYIISKPEQRRFEWYEKIASVFHLWRRQFKFVHFFYGCYWTMMEKSRSKMIFICLHQTFAIPPEREVAYQCVRLSQNDSWWYQDWPDWMNRRSIMYQFHLHIQESSRDDFKWFK